MMIAARRIIGPVALSWNYVSVMRADSMTAEPEMRWLQTPKGRGLLAEECARVQHALENIFGDQFLQIGDWGGRMFLPFARTQRSAMFCESADAHASAVGEPSRLPVLDDSVDAVLLPHVLETNPDPHGVLREVNRILRPNGHVVILGFNPYSLWGVRHLASRRRFPGGVRHLISDYRMRDWLQLLNFAVQDGSFYFFQLPILRRPVRQRSKPADGDAGGFFSNCVRGCQAFATRLMPLAGCYILVARKEIFTLTPIRPVWQPRRRLVGGLVNPTTRNAA